MNTTWSTVIIAPRAAAAATTTTCTTTYIQVLLVLLLRRNYHKLNTYSNKTVLIIFHFVLIQPKYMRQIQPSSFNFVCLCSCFLSQSGVSILFL